MRIRNGLVADIEALVERARDEGAATLASVSSRVLSDLPEPVRTRLRAALVVQRSQVRSERERP